MGIEINAAKALKAKKILIEKLKDEKWLQGISISGDPGDYFLKVKVSEKLEDIPIIIPNVVNGIKVVVEEIKPL